jgi:hypothetical protein
MKKILNGKEPFSALHKQEWPHHHFTGTYRYNDRENERYIRWYLSARIQELSCLGVYDPSCKMGGPMFVPSEVLLPLPNDYMMLWRPSSC